MNQYCSSETQTIHCDPILITRAEHRRRPLLLSEWLCFDAWFIWMEWFNRAWTGSCELSPIAGSVCEELIVPNISLLKFYPHVMQFLCSFVLVYFVLTEWSRTLNRCQCTCHILCHEHSVPGSIKWEADCAGQPRRLHTSYIYDKRIFRGARER